MEYNKYGNKTYYIKESDKKYKFKQHNFIIKINSDEIDQKDNYIQLSYDGYQIDQSIIIDVKNDTKIVFSLSYNVNDIINRHNTKNKEKIFSLKYEQFCELLDYIIKEDISNKYNFLINE